MSKLSAEEYCESALKCLSSGDKNSALKYLQQAIITKLDYAAAWANYGNLLFELGDAFNAMAAMDKAITLQPSAPEFHNNRAAMLLALGKPKAALSSCEDALNLKADFYLALGNKAQLLGNMGFHQEAIDLYRKALEHDPNNAEFHLYLGMSLLRSGQLLEGWKEYEWRKYQRITISKFPEWNGEDLTNKSILVCSEQGFGDAIQFMRYAPLLKAQRGGKVYLEVRPQLLRLAQTIKGIDGVVSFGENLAQKIDYSVSNMSLPFLLGTDSLDDIPWDGPYLTVDAGSTSIWKEKLKHQRGILVGLCWAGQNRNHDRACREIDSRRSLPLSAFSRLSKIEGISWISLQKGPPAEQIAFSDMIIHDFDRDLDDFYDTAALISNLDLVITADTAVAHVAGALGKPVWLLSRYDNCWRWLGDRKDSPWYPNLYQFKQPEWYDWDSVIDSVALKLEDVIINNKPLKVA